MSQIKKYVPTFIDKQLLVWYKKYPSKDKIPHSVNETMMKKVQNKARVHGSLIMMGVTIVASFWVSIRSKRAVQRGESVDKINEDFHKEYIRSHPNK